MYIKRSDLATPSGIDRDYNYLTSIEREFDRAEKEATSRGVLLEPEEKRDGPAKGEANLKAALEKCGAIVARAPKGMSRSKANTTRWLKGSQCLQWTVEWVHSDGRKEFGECFDNVPIIEAYGMLEGTPDSLRPLKRKRTDRQPGEGKKRNKASTNSEKRRLQQDTGFAEAALASETNGSVQVHGQENPQKSRQEDKEMELTPGHNAEKLETPTNTDFDTNKESTNSHANDTNGHISPPSLRPPPTLSFYLHTPSLPSRHPVLAPLSHDAMLNVALRNRLVLEFPTIYIFDQPPEQQLPDGFISEKDFYTMARKELIKEIDEGEIVEDASSTAMGQDRDGFEVEKMDEGKLLEVLGKDLGTG